MSGPEPESGDSHNCPGAEANEQEGDVDEEGDLVRRGHAAGLLASKG
jgi:hypothetical protein